MEMSVGIEKCQLFSRANFLSSEIRKVSLKNTKQVLFYLVARKLIVSEKSPNPI